MILLRTSLKFDVSANYSIAIFLKFCLGNRIRSVQKKREGFWEILQNCGRQIVSSSVWESNLRPDWNKSRLQTWYDSADAIFCRCVILQIYFSWRFSTFCLLVIQSRGQTQKYVRTAIPFLQKTSKSLIIFMTSIVHCIKNPLRCMFINTITWISHFFTRKNLFLY